MSDQETSVVGSSARAAAARVVLRALRDGAFVAAALDAELSRRPELEPRDRGLATELCYGVLRTRGFLEARLGHHAPRKIKDLLTRSHLLVAAYQLLFLERVPAFAAVNAAVDLVQRERGKKLGGFVNAVLRKLAAEGERASLDQAIRQSTPEWLLVRLIQAVGEAEALALLGAGEQGHATSVRLSGKDPPLVWVEKTPRGRLSPRAYRIEGPGELGRLAERTEGRLVIQEEGSQAVALALGAREGERVLDACAGRGQKATLLAELVGDRGLLWAADLHPRKLEVLGQELGRLSLPAARRSVVDWTEGTGDLPDDFDRVLVDAPCSGTGTLRHRPEIRERLQPGDPARLGELGVRILKNAATRARPGGRVLYAVCSVLPEEAEAVVAEVGDLLQPVPFDAPELPAGWVEQGASARRLLPLRDGTDGYFLQSFVRR